MSKEKNGSVRSHLNRLLSDKGMEQYIAQCPSRYRDLSRYIEKYPHLSTLEIAQQIVADMQRVVALINIRERLNNAMMSEFAWTLITADRYFAMKYFAYEVRMTTTHSDAYNRWKDGMSHDHFQEFVKHVGDPTIRT